MIIKSCITEYFNSNNKFIYNINKYRIFIIIKLNINNHVEVEFFIKDSNFFRIRYYNNFIECRVIVNNKYYNYNFIGLINFYNKYYNKKIQQFYNLFVYNYNKKCLIKIINKQYFLTLKHAVVKYIIYSCNYFDIKKINMSRLYKSLYYIMPRVI